MATLIFIGGILLGAWSFSWLWLVIVLILDSAAKGYYNDDF